MQKISYNALTVSTKALQVLKSPKVRIAVLLIAIIAPGFALAGEDDLNGG